jgi:hypothetical protein
MADKAQQNHQTTPAAKTPSQTDQTAQDTQISQAAQADQTAQNAQPEQPEQTAQADQTAQAEPQTYEELIATLPEHQRKLFDDHIAGLKSALDTERKQRKEQEKKLKDLASQAEEGSQLKEQLDKAAEDIAEANRRAELAQARAAFNEEAARQGVKRTSFSLAWLALQDAGLQGKDGTVDWDALKEHYPDLFEQPKTSAAAGSGTRRPPESKKTMDDILRSLVQ